jgi:RHS repeat-associated protein
MKPPGYRIDDSFYGVTSNTRNTIKENDVWTYFTDRNGLGDIIQKSNETEAQLFEYRGDKKLKRFTLIKNGSETQVDYFYDGLGRRVAKLINTPTESFTQTYAYESESQNILLAKDGQGEESVLVNGQLPDEHFAIINTSGIEPYVIDYQGSVINGNASSTSGTFGAFGEIVDTVSTINSSTSPVVYGYAGYQLDLESGTFYLGDRHYDQEAGKFLSNDNLGFAGGSININSYAKNNPLIFKDLNGKILLPIAIGGTLLIGGFVAVNAVAITAAAATIFSVPVILATVAVIATGAIIAQQVGTAATVVTGVALTNPAATIELGVGFIDGFVDTVTGTAPTSTPPSTLPESLGNLIGRGTGEAVNFCRGR